MTPIAYNLLDPARVTSPVVFASPHSGRAYPQAFLRDSVLDAVALRSSEDAYVDMLFDSAPAFGAPLLLAESPRAFVDFNRAADELDPALVRGVMRSGHNPRVNSGLGVIPRVVAGGRSIYRGKMDLDAAMARIDQHWRPYHARLQWVLDRAHRRFGEAILLDCHSMPHEAVASVARDGRGIPDIVIGDRFGVSAAESLVIRVETAFRDAGFEVARNTPFAGAFVTQHYGRPARRQHAIQIEINRALYLNERRVAPSADFERMRKRLRQVIADLAGLSTGAGAGSGRGGTPRLAAE
ncbi:MAG: N-formylglutamate amidohydrolase [Paracoccaceae bacterium]